MQHAAPPPSRPPGVANVRMRRMSAPFQSPQRDLLMESTAHAHGLSLSTRGGTQNTKDKQAAAVLTENESRRESSMLFPMQSKQDQNDALVVVVALQQNVMGLTASNQREKSLNEQLRTQVQTLTVELSKISELYEEERAKNEKLANLRKQKQSGVEVNGGFLPDINTAASAAAAAAALQQQAQLELTYQRKILSLENRYKDLAENNRRLLRKIELLEKTEADDGAIIDNLRQENMRLGTQVDSLSSTVTSQSSLIIGLRTSLQKLHQDEHQVGALIKKYDRSQTELEATKVREKMLRDEHERLKVIIGKEKESLMAKIMDYQQRLQSNERAGDDADALLERIRRLECENRSITEDTIRLRENTVKAETRMHEQEQMTNRLLLEQEAAQAEKKDLVFKISQLQDELNAKGELESKVSTLDQKEREVNKMVARVVELQEELDTANETNTKLKGELMLLQQLQISHDETVQALQLARQRAATHEALSLVNEEKEALEMKLRDLEQVWQHEKESFLSRIQMLEIQRNEMQSRIDQLGIEVSALRNRPPEQVIVERESTLSTEDVDERERIEADIVRLRSEYEELHDTFESMEKDYNKLVTKKYKTESFQSQVKLLQNENTELSSRLEALAKERDQDREEIQARGIEIVELTSRVLDLNAIDMLRCTQESLEKTVSSLVEAETASESTFTCLQCMQLFVSPLTLTPCGHTFCTSCVDKMGNALIPSTIVCKGCAPTKHVETESIFPNQALADLTARFIFRQQTLSSLTTMCLSLRNSFANRSSA